MIQRDALTQRSRQCGKAAVTFAIIVTGAFGTRAGRASDPGAADRTSAEFARHLDALIPALLEGTNVPGASVALVENAEVVWAKGFGLAEEASERRVTADTIFNVGSISKPVTAWAVMTLVEQGRINLDDPIAKHIKRWKLPESKYDADAVTVRRLLSHTAGLSLAAVPEYGPEEEVPDLSEALSHAERGVRIVAQPGSKWDYSGGGYMLLQLMIEDVTGTCFAEFMSPAVLKPLQMTQSGFDASKMPEADLATPYDQGEQPVSYYRYAGLAAAGLYSTANDLAKFVAAGLAAGDDDRAAGVCSRPNRSSSCRRLRMPPNPTTSSMDWATTSFRCRRADCPRVMQARTRAGWL